ncbi:MAG TPA: cobalamin-dependent protein [bacterium]|nr:cobalamin-dependent protein [bacterium]
MRVLLIASPTSFYLRRLPVYPLGLASIATYAQRELGGDYSIVDLNTADNPRQALHDALAAGPYDFIGVNWRNYAFYGREMFSAVEWTVKQVKTTLPNSKLMIGGPGFSLFTKETMNLLPEIDYGVVGCGERAFVALLSGEYEHTPGVVYRDADGVVIENAPLSRFGIDDLPIPHRTWPLLDPANYDMHNLQASRGCSRHCTFCPHERIVQGEVEIYRPERIEEELRQLQRLAPKAVFIADAYVNHDKERTLRLAEIIKRSSTPWWSGQFKPDVYDDQINHSLIDSRIKYPIFGIDTGSPRLCRALAGGFSFTDYHRLQQLIPRRLKPIFSFMINIPGERWWETIATLGQVAWLNLTGRIGVMEPYIAFPYSPLSKSQKLNTWDPRQVRLSSQLGRAYYCLLHTTHRLLHLPYDTPFIKTTTCSDVLLRHNEYLMAKGE